MDIPNETGTRKAHPIPADSSLPAWLGRLPDTWQPYAMLARLDRPVGIWLLFLPCLTGLAFARIPSGLGLSDLVWALLFLAGAVVMRGAGCTWNDITDRRYDARVARTAGRPLASGALRPAQAGLFMLAQLAIGGVIWLALPLDAKLTALLALPLVAIYPFTKRVTWWPQAWLGLTFNWGVLVGAATGGVIGWQVMLLYWGFVLWTVSYDTIYAIQDREDDALIGVRSTARLFGRRAVLISYAFHIAAAGLIAAAAQAQGAGKIGALTALLFLAHGTWQTIRLRTGGERQALSVFRSNVHAGTILAAGFLTAAMMSEPRVPEAAANGDLPEQAADIAARPERP